MTDILHYRSRREGGPAICGVMLLWTTPHRAALPDEAVTCAACLALMPQGRAVGFTPFDYEQTLRVAFGTTLGSMAASYLRSVSLAGPRWYRDAAVAELARRRALS